MSQPFYATQGKVVGSEQTYELRYFRSERDANIDADEITGSYVVQTSSVPQIWRSTRPLTIA